MKKARFLLLIFPVLGGAFYLHYLASFRPQVLFAGQGPINYLVFSGDGQTLLVGQGGEPDFATQLRALDVAHHFATRWTYYDGEGLGEPKFFDSGKRILVDRGYLRSLDVGTGKTLWRQGELRKAAMSPAGNWLAYNGAFSPARGCLISIPTLSPLDVFVESSPQPGQQRKGAIGKKISRRRDTSADDFSFSPDGKTFVVNACQKKTSYLDFYDVKTWKRTRTWSDPGNNMGWGSVQWSPNGRFLLSTARLFHQSPQSPQVKVNLWRARDGKKLSSLTLTCKRERVGFGTRTIVPSFTVQNDGRVLKFGADGPVSLSKTSNLNSGFQELQAPLFGPITAAALSPDGSYLVAGTQSGRVVRKRLK